MLTNPLHEYAPKAWHASTRSGISSAVLLAPPHLTLPTVTSSQHSLPTAKKGIPGTAFRCLILIRKGIWGSTKRTFISSPASTNLPAISTRINLSSPYFLLSSQFPHRDLRPRIQEMVRRTDPQSPARVHFSILIYDDVDCPCSADLRHPSICGCFRTM